MLLRTNESRQHRIVSCAQERGYVVRVYATGDDFLASLPTELAASFSIFACRGRAAWIFSKRLANRRESLADRVLNRPRGHPKDGSRDEKAGAVDFLTKPVDAPVLIDAVARAIARDAENRVVRVRQGECARATLA